MYWRIKKNLFTTDQTHLVGGGGVPYSNPSVAHPDGPIDFSLCNRTARLNY